jgi:hypothetical protein
LAWLLMRTGERLMAFSDVAVPAGAAAARATNEEEGQDELGQRENFRRKMVRASNRVWAEMVIGPQS